jgi:hypothetical protein
MLAESEYVLAYIFTTQKPLYETSEITAFVKKLIKYIRTMFRSHSISVTQTLGKFIQMSIYMHTVTSPGNTNK